MPRRTTSLGQPGYLSEPPRSRQEPGSRFDWATAAIQQLVPNEVDDRNGKPFTPPGSSNEFVLTSGILRISAADLFAEWTRQRPPDRRQSSSVTSLLPLVDYRWRSTRTDAGLAHKLHDLRHYFTSGLIAAGCDVVTVQRAMGHASAAPTLSTDAHLWPTAEDKTPSGRGRDGGRSPRDNGDHRQAQGART